MTIGDFGDVVSIDGLTWANKAGQQLHIYMPWSLPHIVLNRLSKLCIKDGFNGQVPQVTSKPFPLPEKDAVIQPVLSLKMRDRL